MRVLVSLELLLGRETPAASLVRALVRLGTLGHVGKGMIAQQMCFREARITDVALQCQRLPL